LENPKWDLGESGLGPKGSLLRIEDPGWGGFSTRGWVLGSFWGGENPRGPRGAPKTGIPIFRRRWPWRVLPWDSVGFFGETWP